MKKIGQDTVRSVLVPVPPVHEQADIVRYVRGVTDRVDALRRIAHDAIQVLYERRAALISAAVTGQIDVRPNLVAAEPAGKPYSSGFARQILAAEILSRFHSHPTMGRVKLQKLIHMCEYVGQIEEVHGDYRREAAGPFDQRLMFGVVKGLSNQRWFDERREPGRSYYVPLAKANGHAKYLARWQDRMPVIERVLQLLGTQTSQRCEIVSTLYAAWNDLLIDGRTPSDAEIVREATELWHTSKATIAPERWSKALDWMRTHDLVPTGFGAHTRRATTAAKDDA
jgi:type I restriction enzyme S subunit